MKNKYELEITGTVFEFDVIKPVFNYRGLDETLKSVLILEDKVKAMIIQNKSDYDRAKKMRSSINKTFNHLEEARKQAHNELEEPYKKLMEKYKEVKDSVERSTGHIDYMKFVIDQREKSMKKGRDR